MTEPGLSDLPQVRGHSRFDNEAPTSARVWAWVADVIAGWVLTLLAYWAFSWDPLPGWKFFVLLTLAIAAPFFVSKKLFKQSLGERIWGIRDGRTRRRNPSDDTRGGILTISVFAVGAVLFNSTVIAHPYWHPAGEDVSLPAVVPPNDWKVLAFYYTLAPWPAAVGGKAVFYSVPYEMGPPKRFVGDITTNWIPESVRLTIEGPRTPMDYQSRVRARAELKECFQESPLLHPGCVDIRRLTLERHLQELRDQGYTKFKIAWFSSENPGIPEEQSAQGVRLRAFAGRRTQDRYILITPNGVHEAIELSYLDNQEGHLASRDLKVVLGALRISEDLAPGRAWTDSLLESVRLDRLPPMVDGESYIAALSDIQSSLVSMISVNPASFEAYYHLAGSSVMLLRYADKYREDPRSSEIRTLSQAMVERMARYGHDVDPAAPQLRALDQLAQQAKRFE